MTGGVASGRADGGAAERAARGASQRSGYFALVAETFDAAAPTYDATFTPDRSIMAELRRRSLSVLQETLPVKGLMLEIGCGNGAEAVALARTGRRVLATYISPGMVEQTRRRTTAAGLSDRVRVVRGAAHELADLSEMTQGTPLVAAFSSFGALNCEPDLRTVAEGLAALLPTDAPLVLSLMNRWCLWELVWYLVHGQPQRAFRRLRSFNPAWATNDPTADGPPDLGNLPVWYVTPGSLALAFRPWFAVERVAGLGVALPPPALDPWLQRRPRLGRALTWLENRLWDRRPFSWCGDHVLVVLRRTAADYGEAFGSST